MVEKKRASAAADNLRRVRARIDAPEKWCQRTMAMRVVYIPPDDGEDQPPPEALDDCLPEDRGACRFCILGALAAEGLDFWLEGDDRGAEDSEQSYLQRTLPAPSMTLEQFNDHRPHADVLALLDRAIALAEASS